MCSSPGSDHQMVLHISNSHIGFLILKTRVQGLVILQFQWKKNQPCTGAGKVHREVPRNAEMPLMLFKLTTCMSLIQEDTEIGQASIKKISSGFLMTFEYDTKIVDPRSFYTTGSRVLDHRYIIARVVSPTPKRLVSFLNQR